MIDDKDICPYTGDVVIHPEIGEILNRAEKRKKKREENNLRNEAKIREWTVEEDAALRRHINEEQDAQYIAEQMDIDLRAIRCRLKNIGLWEAHKKIVRKNVNRRYYLKNRK